MSIRTKRWLSVLLALAVMAPVLLIDSIAARTVLVVLVVVVWLVAHERLRAQERAPFGQGER